MRGARPQPPPPLRTTLALVVAALVAAFLVLGPLGSPERTPAGRAAAAPLPDDSGAGPGASGTRPTLSGSDTTAATANRSQVRAPDEPQEPRVGLTLAELVGAITAYDTWLEGLVAEDRAAWFEAEDLDGLSPAVRKELAIDRLGVEPSAPMLRRADGRLMRAHRARSRELGFDLVHHAVARFHRRSLDRRQDLFDHALAGLFQQVDLPGLAAGSGPPVVLALSDYLAAWSPDGHLTGEPGQVLLPLIQAAGRSPALLLDALRLVEQAERREVLSPAEVMLQVSLAASQLKRTDDLHGNLAQVLPWLTAPERTEGLAWGHVELLRSLVTDELVTPAEVSDPLWLPDHRFGGAPSTAWAAIELLGNFGDATGGRRLGALFHAWLERARAGDPAIRHKDLALLLDLATKAEGGLDLEDLLPLARDPELGELVLAALGYLAERRPGDERIAGIWRESLAEGELSDAARRYVLHLLIQHGFATVQELEAVLQDPELGEQAAMGLLALGEVRAGPMRALALAADDAVVASELAKAVVRDDPEAGRTLAVDLLGHGLADMRNRGAAWLLAMGALAERRGHGDLAASLRAEILALPEGTLDPGSLGVGHDVSQAALVEALTASFLSGGEALEEQWFAELVPDAIENP